MNREPFTEEQLKTIVIGFWNEYLEDNLSPLDAADLTISELLGSSRLTKEQWSLIFFYVAELYSETNNYDEVYVKKLMIQAEDLKRKYTE